MARKIKEVLRALAYPSERLYADQFMYGHREILIESLSLPRTSVFKGSVQHAWTGAEKNLSVVDLSYFLNEKKRSFVWSNKIKAELVKNGKKNVSLIPSPWSLIVRGYKQALALKQVHSVKTVPNSILYFPSHSYPYVSSDLTENLEEVKEFTKGFNLVTTSLYWIDFLDPSIRNEFAKFSNVTCNGYRGPSANEIPQSPIGGRLYFLYSLLEKLLAHEVILFDDISTAFMCAVTLEKTVMLAKKEIVYQGVPGYSFNQIEQLEVKLSNLSSDTKMDFFRPIQIGDKFYQTAESGFGFDIDLFKARQDLIGFLDVTGKNSLNIDFTPKFLFRM
jgi:hypothetical protein